MISTALLGCSTARNKGTCNNRLNMRRDELEERVLNALRHHLMQPSLFKEFCDEFARETNRLRASARDALNRARLEIKKIDRELEVLLDLILQGGAAQQINKKMLALEKRKAELEAILSESAEPPPSLHPEMASYYRRQVEELYQSLQDDDGVMRLKAVDAIRSLIGEITLSPENGKLAIEVRGDLAGILTVAARDLKTASRLGGVAERARVEEIISQVEMVAGARNRREPTYLRTAI
jgi:hypothetical protein